MTLLKHCQRSLCCSEYVYTTDTNFAPIKGSGFFIFFLKSQIRCTLMASQLSDRRWILNIHFLQICFLPSSRLKASCGKLFILFLMMCTWGHMSVLKVKEADLEVLSYVLAPRREGLGAGLVFQIYIYNSGESHLSSQGPEIFQLNCFNPFSFYSKGSHALTLAFKKH